MSEKDLNDYILTMPGSWLDYPFGEGTAVYKYGVLDGPVQPKMFAIIAEGDVPPRVSLKCDPQLAEVLREKYETVLPGYHLSKKHWNTIIVSGQVPDDELQDLIRHSYELVKS